MKNFFKGRVRVCSKSSKTALFGQTLKTFLLFVVFTFFLTYDGHLTYACDCMVPETAAEAMEQADAVFRGEVIGIKTKKSGIDKYDSVLLEVSETWKGLTDTQVIVMTDWSSCGFSFEVGREYLLYPFYSGDKLFVINCGRSGAVEFAEEDLRQLGQGEAPANVVNLERHFHSNPGWTIVVVILLLAATVIVWFHRRRKKE